jgi:hypothetical protein
MRAAITFWTGLLVILIYGYSVHPPGFARGYSEDMGFPEITRQLMSEQIHDTGSPQFTTDRFMTPQGASIPYMSWSIERDWLGAVFWDLNPDFPFIWFYFVFSMVVTYFGVGFILKKMGLSPPWAWGVAATVVVFHVPRHFKIWHHYEHLLQHWVYWGIFLDAWIWQKFYRERRWSLTLEVWRGLVGLGMLGTVGYFWGPMLLEWGLVRIAMIALVGFTMVRGGQRVSIELPRPKQVAFPVFVALILLAIDWRWYLPLYAEVKKAGPVIQDLNWFGNFGYFVRPLWLDLFMKLPPIDTPETVMSVGWFYWIPAVLGTVLLFKKKRGGLAGPFLGLLFVALIYASLADPPYWFQRAIQAVVPFMNFFRVATRWGLFLPQILTVLIVLAWPELKDFWVRRKSVKLIAATAVFGLFSVLEAGWLIYPVNAIPPLDPHVVAMLEDIKRSPGSAVLDLPFCVAGGNGICTYQQCPNYPRSTLGMELRQWHDKKVYGLYESRTSPSDCEIYDRKPYRSWFQAWMQNRCFKPQEWDDFCGYLGQHSELSAILLYADIWNAAGRSDCLSQFVAHLGMPLDEGEAFSGPSRGGKGVNPTRIFRFAPRCEAAK